MPRSEGYEENYYSSHLIEIENLALTVTQDNGFIEHRVASTQPHSHPVFEIQGCIEGSFSVETAEGSAVRVSEGTLALIPPDLYHSILASEPAQRLTLRFSLLHTKKDGEDLYGCFRSVRFLTAIENVPELIELLCRIRKECLEPGAAAHALCRAYLSAFFLLLYRRLSAVQAQLPAKSHSLSESDDENARYNKIEIFITRHMAEPLCEEDLSDMLGLSVRQTSRVMQQIFGMSFKRKLLQMRLYHARGLLVTSDMPVEEIAAIVGYTSPSGFHIAFKRAFGCTPAEYRAKNRSNT